MPYKNIEASRAYHKLYMKAYRQMLKENKRCVCCGKQDSFTLIGKKICYECLEKYHKKTGYGFKKSKKVKQQTIPRNERGDYGLCYICGKPKENIELKWSGKENRLCLKCYQRLLEVSKRTYQRKLKAPIVMSRKAIENHNKLKAKNELESEVKFLQTNEKSNQCVI